MDGSTVEVALFRACASAILSIDFTPEEARLAAQSLRQGGINLRLAMILDGLVPMPSKDGVQKAPKHGADRSSGFRINLKSRTSSFADAGDLFELIKRRKISKSQLWSIFSQINEEVSRNIDEELSMREGIVKFQRETTKEDWDLLSDIVRGGLKIDPFLARMTGR